MSRDVAVNDDVQIVPDYTQIKYWAEFKAELDKLKDAYDELVSKQKRKEQLSENEDLFVRYFQIVGEIYKLGSEVAQAAVDIRSKWNSLPDLLEMQSKGQAIESQIECFGGTPQVVDSLTHQLAEVVYAHQERIHIVNFEINKLPMLARSIAGTEIAENKKATHQRNEQLKQAIDAFKSQDQQESEKGKELEDEADQEASEENGLSCQLAKLQQAQQDLQQKQQEIEQEVNLLHGLQDIEKAIKATEAELARFENKGTQYDTQLAKLAVLKQEIGRAFENNNFVALKSKFASYQQDLAGLNLENINALVTIIDYAYNAFHGSYVSSSAWAAWLVDDFSERNDQCQQIISLLEGECESQRQSKERDLKENADVLRTDLYEKGEPIRANFTAELKDRLNSSDNLSLNDLVETLVELKFVGLFSNGKASLLDELVNVLANFGNLAAASSNDLPADIEQYNQLIRKVESLKAKAQGHMESVPINPVRDYDPTSDFYNGYSDCCDEFLTVMQTGKTKLENLQGRSQEEIAEQVKAIKKNVFLDLCKKFMSFLDKVFKPKKEKTDDSRSYHSHRFFAHVEPPASSFTSTFFPMP